MLQPTRTKVFAYGTRHLHLLDQFTAEVQHNLATTTSTFLVTKENNTCLLTFNTSPVLGLLNININSITIDHQKSKNHSNLTAAPQSVPRNGKSQVKLEINSTVTRVTQNGRRLPHSMRKKVNEKLKEMEEQDIIEKVDGVTPWISPLIPIPKKGDYRLVLDIRVPN